MHRSVSESGGWVSRHAVPFQCTADGPAAHTSEAPRSRRCSHAVAGKVGSRCQPAAVRRNSPDMPTAIGISPLPSASASMSFISGSGVDVFQPAPSACASEPSLRVAHTSPAPTGASVPTPSSRHELHVRPSQCATCPSAAAHTSSGARPASVVAAGEYVCIAVPSQCAMPPFTSQRSFGLAAHIAMTWPTGGSWVQVPVASRCERMFVVCMSVSIAAASHSSSPIAASAVIRHIVGGSGTSSGGRPCCVQLGSL